MRIVWQREKAEGSNSHFLLTAMVETDDEDRKPHAISALGSIEERFLQTRIRCTREFHQGIFWKTVDQRLESLELVQQDRIKLEKEISLKVPRPGDEWALWGVTCIPRFDPP